MTEFIDLTLELYDGLECPMFPRLTIAPRYTHWWSQRRFEPPCRGVAENYLFMDEHTGTHMDAPFHFWPDGIPLHKIPIETFLGEAKMIDVSGIRNFHEPVNRKLLTSAAEEQKIKIEKGDILLVRVWPGKWGDKGYFEAKQFSRDAAEFFIEKGIRLLGTDMPTADVLTDFQRPVHVSLCRAGIIMVEGLINLDKLIGKKFTFIVLPLRIRDATGSPVRAIAMIQG